MDLSLVPLQDLVDEIEKRHTAFVLATLRTVSGNEPVIETWYSTDTFVECIGLCGVLDETVKEAYMRDDEI